MTCDKCDRVMVKINLEDYRYVGIHKFKYVCPYCDIKPDTSKTTKNKS